MPAGLAEGKKGLFLPQFVRFAPKGFILCFILAVGSSCRDVAMYRGAGSRDGSATPGLVVGLHCHAGPARCLQPLTQYF